MIITVREYIRVQVAILVLLILWFLCTLYTFPTANKNPFDMFVFLQRKAMNSGRKNAFEVAPCKAVFVECEHTGVFNNIYYIFP